MRLLNKSLTVAGVLAAALVLAGCSSTGSGTTDSGTTGSADAEFNDQDVMFVQMMLPHHTQAVEMADMILAKDDIDPAVVDMAQQIKDAQAPEIDLMNGWLDDWGVDPDDMADMSGMEGMEGMSGMGGSGMMSDKMMADLESATGIEASRMFLEQMTEHHNGAIEMAQIEVDAGQFPDAVELAQSIVDSQKAEITQMQDILATL